MSPRRLATVARYCSPALLALLAHLGSLDNFFAGDDYIWLKHARLALTEPLHAFGPWIHGYIRPVSQIVFVVLEGLFGLMYLPYQVALLVLHVANSYLLGLLVLRLGLGGKAIALSAALLFAVWYPKSSTVMWASSLGDVLGLFWILLGLITLTPAEGRPRTRSFWIAALLFVLAAFSKETAVAGFGLGVLRIVLLEPRRAWRACLPLVAALVLYGVAYDALGPPKAVRIVPGSHFFTAWVLFFTFALVPVSATSANLFPIASRPVILLGATMASLVLVAAGLFALLRGPNRLRFLVGWVALSVLLVAAYHSHDPITLLGREIGGQRFVYTASAAVCAAVAWFIATLGRRAFRLSLLALLAANIALVALHERLVIEPRVRESREAWARALAGDRSLLAWYCPETPEVSASVLMLAQSRVR